MQQSLCHWCNRGHERLLTNACTLLASLTVSSANYQLHTLIRHHNTGRHATQYQRRIAAGHDSNLSQRRLPVALAPHHGCWHDAKKHQHAVRACLYNTVAILKPVHPKHKSTVMAWLLLSDGTSHCRPIATLVFC